MKFIYSQFTWWIATAGSLLLVWLLFPITVSSQRGRPESTTAPPVESTTVFSDFSETQEVVTLTEATTESNTVPVTRAPEVTLPQTTTANRETQSEPPSSTEPGVTEDPVFVIDEECRVPDDASINNVTVRSTPVTLDDVLVLEGRCYTACMEFFDGTFRSRAYQLHKNYSPWFYYTLKSDYYDRECTIHQAVHECTRGCIIQQQNPTHRSDCSNFCQTRCTNRCGLLGGCNDFDHSEVWLVRDECSQSQLNLECDDYLACQQGCNNIHFCDGSNCQPPLSPINPPYLTPVVTNDRVVQYQIDLTNTVPTNTYTANYVAFLFEIFDVTTGNYSYTWLTDPRTQILDLTDFSCREVAVSFAVANKNGWSNFSESFRIPQVKGDQTRRPDPITDLAVSIQADDTRVGFFGHVIWTITWNHPQSQLHLQGYSVEVLNSVDDTSSRCVSHKWAQSLSENETTVEVSAREPGGILIMGCTYTVKIHAIGQDENVTRENTVLAKTFPSRPWPTFIRNFNCHKLWDSDYKFSFNLTWSLPLYVAASGSITGYNITLELIDLNSPESNQLKLMDHYNPTNVGLNETNFYYFLPHGGDEFYRPRRDDNYKFKFSLSFNFNQTVVEYPILGDSGLNGPVECTEDAISPPPSQVRNLTVHSYTILSRAMIQTTFSWKVPLFPNGILTRYYTCMNQMPLESDEEPQTHGEISFCHFLNGTEEESTLTMNYIEIQNSYCLYLQIRAENEFVSGIWSDPAVIYLGVQGNCSEGPVTTQLSTDEPSITLKPFTSGLGNRQSNSAVVIGVSVTVPLIVLLCCCALAIFTCVCVRTRRRKWGLVEMTDSHDLLFSGGPKHRLLTQMSTDPKLPEISEWEISPSEVLMEDKLGEGAFGEVYKGVVTGPLMCSKLRPSLRNAIAVPVAIKLLKESAVGSERKDFLSEIDMMKMISEGHNPNVIGLIGCVTLQEPLSLILEYVVYGDLLSYLRTNMKINAGHKLEDEEDPYLQLGSIEPMDLVNFSYQIASGMEYLSSLGIVHRDLACRNILVDDGKVLKITDFGMSREIDEIYIQKSTGRVPLKWMALESILTREFTTASDVWSYGITLWEISTMGGHPYPSINNEQLLPLLKNGYRMEKPENCSPEIYDIMLSCWNGDPNKRLTFTELKLKFDKMLQSNAEYIYFLPVNSDKACYKPENAPEGMDIARPVRPLHSPNLAQNRLSLSAYRLGTCAKELSTSQQSVSIAGKSSGRNSPCQRSQRSVSPSPNVSSRENTTGTSNGTIPQASNRGRSKNLYVKDPSMQQSGLSPTQARPASLLVPNSTTISPHLQINSSPTGHQENGHHRYRPTSIAVGEATGTRDHSGSSSVPAQKNVASVNLLFAMHTDSIEHTDEEQGTRLRASNNCVTSQM